MSAITANKVINIKDVDKLHAFPVKSGETIYQGGFAGISVDGYAYDLDSAIIPTSLIVGIVADDSANTTPAATTADGSVADDRSSADAGDKTVRKLYLSGRVLCDFAVTLSQDEVGKIAYAINNNDCSINGAGGVPIGTIVAFVSTSQAWVELNTYFGEGKDGELVVRRAVAGSTSTAAGGLFTIANPFGAIAILKELVFSITTASTGAATADIGVGASSSVDNLMDGLTLNGSITGLKLPAVNSGTNGNKIPAVIAADGNILATASADSSGLVGVVMAKFKRWDA
jgi:hypothetical protein